MERTRTITVPVKERLGDSADQLQLLPTVDLTREEVSGLTIQERFETFRARNPHVERLLLDGARRAQQLGFRRIGIDFLYHQLRWNYAVQTRRSPDEFKLNDHFTSRYSRLLVELDPSLDGLFEMRRLRSA